MNRLCTLQLTRPWPSWVSPGTLRNLLLEGPTEAAESDGELGPRGWIQAARPQPSPVAAQALRGEPEGARAQSQQEAAKAAASAPLGRPRSRAGRADGCHPEPLRPRLWGPGS